MSEWNPTVQWQNIEIAGANVAAVNLSVVPCQTSLQRFRFTGPNKLVSLEYMCYGCTALVTIPELNVALATNMVGVFDSCTALRSVSLVLPSSSFSVAGCALGHDALVGLIGSLATVEEPCICNVAANTGTAELTEGEIAVATAKGWTLILE